MIDSEQCGWVVVKDQKTGEYMKRWCIRDQRAPGAPNHTHWLAMGPPDNALERERMLGRFRLYFAKVKGRAANGR